MSDEIPGLDAWLEDARELFGLPDDPGAHAELLLKVASVAAHTVARPAAPLTTFLVGLAAGLRGGTPEQIDDAAAAILARLEARATPEPSETGQDG